MTYKHINDSGLPYNLERPLIFHEMSTIPPGLKGQKIFRDLIHNHVVLMPLNDRGEEEWKWDIPKHSKNRDTQIFTYDIAAGDDKYLFFTPCHPLHDDQFLSSYRPAIAFDALDLIQRATTPGFRPRDLEVYYQQAIHATHVDDSDEENVFSASEELSAVAEILTRSGIKPVMDLIKLYSDLLFGTGPAHGDVRDIDDLFTKLDNIVRPETQDDIVEWLLEEHNIDIDPGHEWSRIFESVNKYPYVPRQPPEVIIDAAIPLDIGLFYRGEDGHWYPMNKLLRTVESSLTQNPGVMYVSPSERRQ